MSSNTVVSVRNVTNLAAAFQLHYHLCLPTKAKRPHFAEPALRAATEPTLISVCQRYLYHLLDFETAPGVLRLLLSLRPEHRVAEAVKAIRGNLWAAFRREGLLAKAGPFWSRGYFVRSVGQVTNETVEQYVTSQFQHHELPRSPQHPGIYSAPGDPSALRTSAHATFELNHHFVFVVARRDPLLDPEVAQFVQQCFVRTAEQNGWIPWKVEVLPEHGHLVVGSSPTDSPEEVAGVLMNAVWELMHERCREFLRLEGLQELWKPGYFVRSVGSATTAQVRSFMGTMRVVE